MITAPLGPRGGDGDPQGKGSADARRRKKVVGRAQNIA